MEIKKEMLLGILVTFLLAIFSVYLSTYVPRLGSESIAMLIGILLGNTVFFNEIFSPGIKWSEKYPIEIGIALMGLTVTLKTIENLGIKGILFVILQMTLTIIFVLFMGKKIFRVSKESALLMSAGNAVCGSSAIASVAPVIKANDNQRRTAVATVSLTGVMLLLILPTITPRLFNNNLLSGALVGGVVQSVGQVVGTASLINSSVVTYATLFKMLRIILLTVVVIIFAKMMKTDQTTPVNNKIIGKINIPWFIIVFIIFLIINSIFALPKSMNNYAKEIASFFGVINLAGIGLNLKFKTIKDSGVKFLSYGFITGIIQVILAILLIKIIF